VPSARPGIGVEIIRESLGVIGIIIPGTSRSELHVSGSLRNWPESYAILTTTANDDVAPSTIGRWSCCGVNSGWHGLI